jgi:peptidyl-prolyl cis-trans isomerase D
MKRHAESQIGELSPAQEQTLKKRAIKELIFNRVVLQGGESAGYLVTREQAEQALMQIPQFQEDGQFSAEKFQQALSSALYTPAVFLTKIQEGLMINQQRFTFAGTAFVLPNEVSQLVALAKQTRDVGFAVLPWQNFAPPAAPIVVSPDELKDYYEKNKAQFKVPEKVSVNYILVSMKNILNQTHVSEKALKNYYEDNIDAYTHPAQWRWKHILIRVSENNNKADKKAYETALKVQQALRKGQKFSVAVKKYSDDILSAAQDGLTPWVPELAVDEQILPVLQQLKKGEISTPIKTHYGYEIIELAGYQKPVKIPFKEVRKQIQDTLKTDKAQQVFAQMGDDLTNLSYQNPSSLKGVAQEIELPIKTTPLFTQKGLSKGITSYKQVVRAAFSDEVLRDGDNSQVIAIDDSFLLVLHLNKHLPSSVQSLDAVKDVLRQQITQKKAAEKAEEAGKEWIKALSANPSTTLPVAWTEKKAVSRDDSTINPLILTALFKMSLAKDKMPLFEGVALDNGDYAILKLAKVQSGSMDNLDSEEQKMFEDEMEAAEGIVDYNLYVEGLMDKAKIVEDKK